MDLRWHDQQRIGQVLAFAIVAIAAPLIARSSSIARCLCNRRILVGLAAAWCLGILSALQACYPTWSFVEVSLMFMNVALGWTVAMLHARAPATANRLLLVAVFLVCAALALRFLVAYASVTTCGVRELNPRLLLDGFSNVRFFAQFQALTLPLIVFPLMVDVPGDRGRGAFAILAGLWWAVAFVGGGRGLVLAMVGSMAILAWLGGNGRRWAHLQLRTATAGFLLFLLFMNVIPAYLGLEVKHHPATRDLTTLSGRKALWGRAAGQIRRHPWLGVGPMHFQEKPGMYSVHPHQALLQWAAEWGLPSAFLVLGAVGTAAAKTVRTLRTHSRSSLPTDMLRVCLAGSILSAAILSMVDGVIVMPYTMLWLAILSGWLLALHPGVFIPTVAPAPFTRALWSGGILAATMVLVSVVSRDTPKLPQRIREYSLHHPRQTLHPRFWLLGSIHPESGGALRKNLICH